VSSTSRSVILGAHTGLPARSLEPFVRSLRATKFNGSLCIVAGHCDAVQLEQLRGLADCVVDVEDDYSSELRFMRRFLGYLRRQRGLRRTYPPAFEAVARASTERAALRRWSCLEYHLEGLQALRYLHYHRFLVAHAPDADVVMLSDLRDVVFQRDPFTEPVDGLELYLEDASVRLGEDAFNTRWIRDLFGSAELEAMRGRPVSCSGTVVGTRQAILAYLAEMVAGIVWRRRPMGAHDQAVHNRLIERGLLPDATLVRNGYGRVLTLGAVETFELSPDGAVMNSDGSVPAVLHQWDRHAALVARIEQGAEARIRSSR
jgi:hypothetical protein